MTFILLWPLCIIVQGDDLEYVKSFINAANRGSSNNFIGYEVIIDLILALRDTNQRLKELEENSHVSRIG